MHLLIIMNLNDSLMRAKFAPLLRSGAVKHVTVVARRVGPDLPRVRYVVAPDRGGAVRRTLILLGTAVHAAAQARPNLVMAYNLMPFGVIALIVARLRGVPFGLNVIGGATEIKGGGVGNDNRVLSHLGRSSRMLEHVMLWIVRRADFVTTTGGRTRQFLIAHGVPPEVIHALSSVIDPAEFRTETRPLHWDLVCVSSMLPRKRLDLLIDLVAELVPLRPGLRVAIVGDGPLRADLERRIRQLGLQRNIELLGFHNDVREILWSSRLFVMTSRAEGLPLSLIEAAACRVAPVVCDFDDVRDLIEDGVNGRLIPIDEVWRFRDVLLDLLDNEPRRAAYAAAAQQSAYARYTIDAATRKWRVLFDALSSLPGWRGGARRAGATLPGRSG